MRAIKHTPADTTLITIQDAARELACAVITIRRLIREGRLRAIRFSATMVRIERSELDAFIAKARA